jgi:anaerobic nitric oxide reductase flavorubredoxin
MKHEIAKNVYWVGAIDWNVRHFHGHTYTTKRGTTYNAYLIIDDKIALVDTVDRNFSYELLTRIKEVIDPSKIDYIIANHGEPDHSGSIPDVMALAPNATLVYSRKGADSIGKYYPNHWKTQTVKTGDTIHLGHNTLSFVEAPMLHWPDTMFTYIPEQALLLPNDAFGQHVATSERFADEVDQALLWDQAAEYYANILTPFSAVVVRKIEEVQKMGIRIDTIAPSHGLIWRTEPMKIVAQYLRWAKGEAEPRVVIAYETMWGATDKLASAIVEGITSEGLDVRMFRVPDTDHTEVVKEILTAKGVLFGSSTHNQHMLLNIAKLMHDVKGLKFMKKVGAAFGVQGWAGGSVTDIEGVMKEAGFTVAQPGLATKWQISDEEWQQAVQFGKTFAQNVRGSMA